MATILVKDAAVITMEGRDRVIGRGDIAIRGRYIEYVGPSGTVPDTFIPDRTVSAGGMVAAPGFVNCHTHAAMTLMRGYADDIPLMKWLKNKIWPFENGLTDEDIYWGSMLCCLEMIKSGTTTFADMYFHMDRVAEAVDISGMRADLSRGMVGTGPEAESAMEYSRGFAGRWNGKSGGRITVRLGPHAPYTCPPEYLQRVVDLARELGLGIHIHLAETLDEIRIIEEKYGRTPVQLMEDTGLFEIPVLAAHCVHLNGDDIEILARRKVGVAHNPESNMKLASGVAPVTAMLRAGVKVGLGTDGAASNNNLDMFGEMRSAALLQKVHTMDATSISAYEALYMATAGGAEALNLEGEIGKIKAGYKADIILLNTLKPHFHPQHDIVANLVYAGQPADVDTVIIDGSIVMEGRQVMTIDENEVYLQVGRCTERLVETVKGRA